jgi:hypothetical protein
MPRTLTRVAPAYLGFELDIVVRPGVTMGIEVIGAVVIGIIGAIWFILWERGRRRP